MRTRAWRRAQRERVVARRLAEARLFRRNLPEPGRLARGQAFLGCPSGRFCGVCHPGKENGRRVPTLQETREALDPLADLMRWKQDDQEAAFEAAVEAEMRWIDDQEAAFEAAVEAEMRWIDEREALDDWCEVAPWEDL